jgi:hypothetical protein
VSRIASHGFRARIAALGVLLVMLALVFLLAGPGRAIPVARAVVPGAGIPLLAHYYIWFDTGSWTRAKIDYPLIGRYSSDRILVMRQHIRWAKQSGVQGFIVSWKHTVTNDRNLRNLVQAAEIERFNLAITYQGLDFNRNPLPIARVRDDFNFFANNFGHRLPFRFMRKPLIAWSGTWEFSTTDIASVTGPLRKRLTILATEKSVTDYERVANLVDGDLYYWSSVNPQTNPNYPQKLVDMSAAVHSHGGIWIAPAAPGFDARLVGGTTVVERFNGDTLREEFAGALASSPDYIGLISWNEFSENTHVEPSENYAYQYLNVLSELRGAPGP